MIWLNFLQFDPDWSYQMENLPQFIISCAGFKSLTYNS